MKHLTIMSLISVLLLWIGVSPAQGQADLNRKVLNYLQQSLLVMELDNRCDVLTLEGRMAAEVVRQRIHHLSIYFPAEGRQRFSDLTKETEDAAKQRLKPGCETFSTEPSIAILARQWNETGLSQLAVLDDVILQKYCKLDRPTYSFLRAETARAMAALESIPETRWKPAFTKRRDYYRKQCTNGRMMQMPRENIEEVSSGFVQRYWSLQDDGIVDGKMARFGQFYGRRGLPDGTRVEFHNDRQDYPYRLRVTNERGLTVQFEGDKRPKGESLGSLFLQLDGTQEGRNLKSGEGDLWTLSPDGLSALLNAAEGRTRPSFKLYLETWEAALDGEGDVFVGEIHLDDLRAALDYSEFETP